MEGGAGIIGLRPPTAIGSAPIVKAPAIGIALPQASLFNSWILLTLPVQSAFPNRSQLGCVGIYPSAARERPFGLTPLRYVRTHLLSPDPRLETSPLRSGPPRGPALPSFALLTQRRHRVADAATYVAPLFHSAEVVDH